MKILFDLTPLADNFSGVERFALNISKAYIEQHNEYEYILLFKGKVHSAYEDIANASNVKAVVLKSCSKLMFSQFVLPFKLYQISADAYFFLAFPEPLLLFKKNMYTAIHDMCCWDVGDTMAAKSKHYYRLSNLHSMRFCKRIITISEFSRQRIESIGKVKKENIHILYCGVGEEFKPVASTDAHVQVVKEKYKLPHEYILSLSTLEPRKNLRLLLQAYDSLLKEEEGGLPALVLAGRKGWKMDGLLAGLSDDTLNKIHFTGFVDDQDLPYLYGRAMLFVFPSKYEGFGLPPLEAMACGAPVLSSDAASLPEVLGGAAEYFKSDDCNELKDMLNQMIELPNGRRVDMMELGYKQVSLYDWSVEADKLHLVIRGKQN